MNFVKQMKLSIKTLLYVKKISYFGIAELAELAKLAKIAMKDSQKIVRNSEKIVKDSEISGISEISENSDKR